MIKIRQNIKLTFRDKRTLLLLILSLTVGLTTYILISAKVNYNQSFDKHFKDSEFIYRIVSSAYKENTLIISQPRCQRILGETLESSHSQVLQSGYLCETMTHHYKIGDATFMNDNSFHCSNGFVYLFTLEFLQGDTSALLTRPNVAIVSESFARKYFGDENPIGKTIHQYPSHKFEIEAVYSDLPPNTHFNADFFLSFHDNMHLPPPLKANWGEFSFYTYLKVNTSAEITEIEDAMSKLSAEHNKRASSNSDMRYDYRLQPIDDIHTKSQLKNEVSQNIRGDYLLILELISILILIASGFNYVYFSHNRITNNSKQYGLRKIFGAGNGSLLIQLLTESFVIHLIALILSINIVTLAYQFPVITNNLKHINLLTKAFWLSFICIYTASILINPFVLLLMFSRKTSLVLLLQKRVNLNSGFSYRQVLTMIQFMVIVFLISSILGINKQLEYLKNKDKGIDISNKLVIKTPSHLRRNSGRIKNLDAFEQELMKIPGVHNVSMSNNVPGDTPSFNYNASEQKNSTEIKTALIIADNNFFDSYAISNLNGGNFDKENIKNGCVINSTCMKQLGYNRPEEIMGQRLFLQDENAFQTIETNVAGVCEDFNFTSIKEQPSPTIILDWTENIIWGKYTLTVDSGSNKSILLSEIKAHFYRTFPNYPFEYFWVEDVYNNQFSEEKIISLNLNIFALIAILLGVLSMFSMVLHITMARTKEIGIRKINGAKALDIIRMLNVYFLKWIVLASFLAIPFSWYFLVQWLKSFEYKTNIGAWIFIVSIGSALLIGFITVTWQSFRVANMNPAYSIKDE
ncbi:MAG: ABC transporter permease [Marinilabiliaceae bacterium]|nr:ABC transporter permease [Marinilabiliaceae bacterium]